MRSIFRIGCILVVIASLLVSGAMAETMDSSTVDAVVAQAGNVTETAREAAVTVGAAAAQAGNLTESAQDVLAAFSGAEAGAAEPDLVNDTLVKFVTDARTFALGSGKAAAISTFSNPLSGYITDDMYIFAYDYDGKALCLPYNPGMVGLNQIPLADSTGFKYVQQMRDTAKGGVGFVRYQEADMMNKGQIAKKVSYVTDVDGTYWIGAGVYVREEEQKPAAVVKAVTIQTGNLTAGTEAVVDAVQSVAENMTA